jgi:hypothetical protein
LDIFIWRLVQDLFSRCWNWVWHRYTGRGRYGTGISTLPPVSLVKEILQAVFRPVPIRALIELNSRPLIGALTNGTKLVISRFEPGTSIQDKRVRDSLNAGVRAHLTQSSDTVPKRESVCSAWHQTLFYKGGIHNTNTIQYNSILFGALSLPLLLYPPSCLPPKTSNCRF